MRRTARLVTLAGSALLAVACAEKITSAIDSGLLDAAFTSTPLAFTNTTSSFSSSSASDSGEAFMPDGGHHGARGRNGLVGGADFMGGGFGPDFLGGPLGGGRPFDRGGLGGNCAYSAATGVVTCPAVTRGGITVTRTAIYKDGAGATQASFDSLTNSVTTHTDVSGTQTRREGIVTTVKHTSDQTVTGLLRTATQRTVSGTSAGTENTAGKDSVGAFTVARTIGDTVTGIVIPIASGKPTYPTAGTVVRSMTAVLTYSGKSPTTSTRREVITYDGSATAKLVITQDGTTKTCTLPLPHGRPSCS